MTDCTKHELAVLRVVENMRIQLLHCGNKHVAKGFELALNGMRKQVETGFYALAVKAIEEERSLDD